jgi:SAM-dependent methyltransferase
MHRLALAPGAFDAVLSLWQSFGYFDDATNLDVLRQVRRALTPGGRLVLDVYHRGFFERHQGTRRFERAGTVITETKYMSGDRLTVHLTYGVGGDADIFDWQIYTPEELQELAATCGFRCLVACTGFEGRMLPSPETPRMQFVFEKALL